ncbi:hypothetical protein [Salirhabdus sp. Marseille-P4669]|uniref:hypothetical protein n=1 Tax=Salirhabdus sp. Marseille-P4669 TaxID=2042310 RepID=UPI00135B72DA|nr:hypothetical protein [Salirhabdus sp. Marseille-P4669]
MSTIVKRQREQNREHFTRTHSIVRFVHQSFDKGKRRNGYLTITYLIYVLAGIA